MDEMSEPGKTKGSRGAGKWFFLWLSRDETALLIWVALGEGLERRVLLWNRAYRKAARRGWLEVVERRGLYITYRLSALGREIMWNLSHRLDTWGNDASADS